MEISALPLEIQVIIHQRQKEQGNDGTFVGELSRGKNNNNFNWKESPEGPDFWSELYNYGWEKVKNHPLNPIKSITYEIF